MKDIMWNIDFRDKINVEELNKKIDTFLKLNPTTNIILQAPSTQGASSSFVKKIDPRVKIRIAAAYDDERLEKYKNVKYESGADCKEAHIDSVIYTRNETVKILEVIEEIESGIMENWSELQKALYIYDWIKTNIMYDPKYETKSWAEIRSLRGLITKQTVCAGYSMMLKEILERQGIQCKFVAGNGHAWNVIVIDDIMYSADLTTDNQYFRSGHKFSHVAFGQRESEFTKIRKPANEEPDTTYIGRLTHLDPLFIERLSNQITVEKEYEATANIFTRSDNTRFYLAQVGKKIKNGKCYCKYYYSDITKTGEYQNPKILYMYLDVFKFINARKFNEPTLLGYDYSIRNVLFSQENIKDSERKNTGYLGEELKAYTNIPVNRISDVKKAEEDIYNLKNTSRKFTRRDGSNIIVEEVEAPEQINGKIIYKFKTYEQINKNGTMVVKMNQIYTEENLLKTTNLNIADYLLGRERLNKKALESGGYIGYIDANGKIKVNTSLKKHYNQNISVEAPFKNSNRPIILPRFKELEHYARTYEILYNKKDNSIVVRDLKTKKKVENERLKLKAIFANIWLVSAGLKTTKDEARKGVKDAFDNKKRNFYNVLCLEILKNYQEKGYIDTVEIYKLIAYSNNKDGKTIMANLFQNEFQSNYIDELFKNISKSSMITHQKPIVLHNVDYADKLIFKYNQTQIDRLKIR